MTSTLNWLHLSDIHFHFDNFDTRRLREKLVDKIIEEAENRPIHFVTVTGDLVFQGKAYTDKLEIFLSQALEACGLGRDRLFMVPGNHDVKRTLARSALAETLQERETFEDTDGSIKKEMLKWQSSFYRFYRNFKGDTGCGDGICWTYRGDQFNILHMNTALLSGRDKEEGKLKFDLSRLMEETDKIKNSDKLNIALGHHTLECFSERDRQKIFNMFEDYGLDLYLCGHVHRPGARYQDLGTKLLPEIVSGAGITGKYGDAGFVLGSYDREAADCRFTYYSWDNLNEQWVKDTKVSRRSPEGTAVFPIDRLRGDAKLEKQDVTPAEGGAASVDLHRLPTPLNIKYFGRKRLMNKIRRCLESGALSMVCLYGLSGSGKSSLIDQLMRDIAPDYLNAQYVFGWHFYSQENQLVTDVDTGAFFDQAIRFFSNGAVEPEKSEFQKIQQLLSLIRTKKCVLVLDGIEILLNSACDSDGYFRDQTMYQFLLSVAREGLSNGGMIIITSRQKIVELERYAGSFANIPITEMTRRDAVNLLKYHHLRGKEQDFEEVVDEYKCHPLTLTLFARILNDVHGGNLALRGDISRLSDFNGIEKKLDRLIGYYCVGWKADQSEKFVMMYLSLFKRPASYEELDVLIQHNELSRGLRSATKLAAAVSSLKKVGLLLEGALLDTHALIREYFFLLFSSHYPDVFQKSNRILFHYYNEQESGEQIRSVKQLDPLYRSIYYGCQGELYGEALQVLWEKVFRRRTFFSHRVLGAVSNDFFAISQFFTEGWQGKKGCSLPEEDQAWLLAVASYLCFLSGRLRESAAIRLEAMKRHKSLKAFTLLSYDRYHLADVYTLLSDIPRAVKVMGRRDLPAGGEEGNHRYSKDTDYKKLKTSLMCRKAFSCFLAGSCEEASTEFQAAEREYGRPLEGTNGFYYFCLEAYRDADRANLKKWAGEYRKLAEREGKDYETALGIWMEGIFQFRERAYGEAAKSFELSIRQMIKSGRVDKMAVLQVWLCKCFLELFSESGDKQYLQRAANEIEELKVYIDVYQMRLYEPDTLLLESKLEKLRNHSSLSLAAYRRYRAAVSERGLEIMNLIGEAGRDE